MHAHQHHRFAKHVPRGLKVVAAIFVSHTPRTVTTPYEIVFNQAERYDIGNGGGFTKKRKEKKTPEPEPGFMNGGWE